MSHTGRMRIGIVTAVAAALLSVAAGAFGQATGSIHGTVTDQSGTPLAGICVFAFPQPDSSGLITAEGGQTRTSADGSYELSLDPAGYKIRFVRQDDQARSEDNCSSLYHEEWHPNATEGAAAVVTVEAGARVAVDAALVLRGGITGGVTDSMGRPLAGVVIDLVDGERFGATITGADGAFVAGVGPGNWTIHARSTDRAYGPARTGPVGVGPGEVAEAALTLPLGASISGAVTDETTGEPLEGITVRIVDSTFTFLTLDVVAVTTDSLGRFVIGQLPPGTHGVRYDDEPGRFVGEVLPTPITVQEAQVVSDANAALEPAGFIAGEVRDAQTGYRFDSACVTIYNRDGEFIRGGFAGGPGYRIGGIPTGDAFAFFDLCGAISHLGEWYDDAPSLDQATPIAVTAGQTTLDIDVALSRDPALGGNIQGRVLDLDGRPIPMVVELYASDGSRAVEGVSDHATGEFWMPPVPAGDYTLLARPQPGQFRLPLWHGTSLSRELSIPITVEAGLLQTGIEIRVPWFEPFDPDASVALVEPNTARWHLFGGDQTGSSFYYGLPGDQPVLGDWDGDGVETPGMFRPSTGFAYVRNQASTGVADTDFFFGEPGDLPLAGDWDGDGDDTLGIYRPREGKVYLTNDLRTRVADIEYYFGMPGDRPFAGDFDGDGDDEVGLYRQSDGLVYLRLSHTTGVADLAYYYGEPLDLITSGDWDGDGTDGLAIFRPGEQRVYLRDDNSQGVADYMFEFWSPNVLLAG